MSHVSSFTKGKLCFSVCSPDGARPSTVYDDYNGTLDQNLSRVEKEITIENLRGKEDSVTLDTTGFQLFRRPTECKAFADDEDIKRDYYPECAELCRELTGADHVVIFSHVVRRRQGPNIASKDHDQQPISHVHGDMTPKSAARTLNRYFPASQASSPPQRRFQIVNLWRPISHPAFDWPLALCDYRSVDLTEDIFVIHVNYGAHASEGLAVKYNANQSWKYFSGMSPDEFIVFKTFDSAEEGSFALHAAFKDPAAPEMAPPRVSIEVRALLIFEEKEDGVEGHRALQD